MTRRTRIMRKSIITTLVVSIVCLLVGGVLVGVSVYQMTNPFMYSYDFADGFFSYTMKYASSMATNSVYYQSMFQIGKLLVLCAVILGGATLIAHIIDTKKIKPAKVSSSTRTKAEPIDIPVQPESTEAKADKEE